MTLKIEVGFRSGRLTVIKEAEGKNNQRYYECLCECGNTKVINSSFLFHGISKSCGCLVKEHSAKMNYKHGLSKHKLHVIWSSMKGRCLNPNNEKYKSYGARGIKICKEWVDDFKVFYDWAYANGYKKGLSIERVDVNGNYEPSNCMWIELEDQQRNTTLTKRIEFNGETLTLRQWSLKLGANDGLVSTRLRMGWSVKEALTIPPGAKRKVN